VQYTLAKGRLDRISITWHTALLLVVLFSSILPWGYHLFTRRLGESAWAQGAFLFVTGMVLSLAALPLDWHEQFRLEERFGFNTATQTLWWTDRLKGLALALVLGYPLLVLVLKLVEWTGDWWWLWAWGAVLGFQLLMVVLAPALIMPLFNKFTPLPLQCFFHRLWPVPKNRSLRHLDRSTGGA
jgi:STE24 endopeptidase